MPRLHVSFAAPTASPPARLDGAGAAISTLVASRARVEADEPVRRVAERFLASPNLHAAAVTRDGAPVGLLTRARLLLTLARSFGHELFARKPVTRIADLHPLVLPGSTQLGDAVAAALRRGPETVYDEIVVVDGGGQLVGLLPVHQLVLEQGYALARNALAREEAARRAADLERLDAERRRFLAHATHELRSPVNALVMLAELVRLACERRSWDEVEERVPVLTRTAATLRTTIGAMLDLSRLEAGAAPVIAAPVDLGALVREVAATTQLLAAGKPVAVTIDAPPPGALHLGTDAQKLKQIVLNLASNAAKFTDEGTIVLGASRSEDGARVWVADTGPGIPPEDVSRLFQPFSQLEAAETKRHAGSGLGLAISRSLAQVLGASIEVESRPGEGSTFTVALPARPPEDPT